MKALDRRIRQGGCRRAPALVLAVFAGLQSCAEAPAARPPIAIDGRFGDWDVPATLVLDSADAPDGEVDLGDVRILSDTRALFLLIDLGRDVNIQGLRGGLTLLLDTDGEPASGRVVSGMGGVDLEVRFGGGDAERSGFPAEGVSIRPTVTVGDTVARLDAWGPAVIGLRFEPRHTARRIELRIERESGPPIPVAFLSGERVRGKLVFRSETGALVDETPVFTHQLDPGPGLGAEPSDPVVADPFVAPPGTGLRVVSWNVSRENFLRFRDSFARVLVALRPDVLLLDEVPPAATPELLQSFFSRVGGRRGVESWRVLAGAAGGMQRGVIAARSPVDAVAELERVPYPSSISRVVAGAREEDFARVPWLAIQEVAGNVAGGSVPTVGGVVRRPEGDVLAVTLDLVCCGNREGSLHDRVRRAESTAIGSAVRRALARLAPAAVIVGGDFNLVGSRVPLDVMAAGLDPDGSDLAIVDALQLDGVSSATWEEPSGPFPPGQLDYLLYSDGSLELLQAFVFDARDVSADRLRRVDVRKTDTERASDHLPVVADFRWRWEEAR